jgi:PAS domain S-box-containing protein
MAIEARILLVEDEGIIAEDLQTSLEEMGYDIVGIAATGEEAVKKAVKTKPDLVLMDIVLRGEMDGIEAADRIRETVNCPVIYLTAYADDKILERAKSTEPFGYLIKPIQDRELYSNIEMAIFKHEMDAKLRESEAWFSVTFNSIGDAVIASDEAGLVKFMNPVAESVTGWKQSDALGKPLQKVFNLSGLEEYGKPAIFEQMGAGNGSERCRVLTTRDGRTLVVDTRAAPIRDEQGAVFGTVAVFRDVTEAREAGERLRFLSAAVEQTLDGIAVTDLEGNLLFINRAFANIHGYEPHEMIGLHLSVFHTEDQLSHVEDTNRIIREKGEFCGEIWHVRKDGEIFPALMHNSLLRDRGGAPVGMIGALRDITELKKTQDELIRSHEQLEAYSVSLEDKVKERTYDLEKSQRELKKYSESLEKTNEALKIIIQGIEEQKKEIEEKIAHNLNLTVKPIFDQMRSQDLPETVGFLIRSLEFNISNIFTSFGTRLIKDGHRLTPKEVRICEMIRSGLSSKQIGKVLEIATQTVLVHRKNIRKKLGLAKTKQNLASYLKASL